ncbi:MAG: phosphatidate cytidylyltransferase [Polyangiaceae bacterium]|nr:phosphatidate cytidylyltransferase [Polyangiaceae bacterium]
MRLLTAAVAAPLILLLLFLGPIWAWLTFIALAAAIGAFELFGMTHDGDRVAQVIGVLLVEGVAFTLFHFGFDARVLVTMILVLPIVAQLLALWRLGDMSTAALRMMATVFGPLYLGGGMAAIVLLKRDAGGDGPGFVLLALMLSWLSDTGAYFAGRFLGKRKLYPAVSPKKTIAGAFGGLGGAIAGALLASFFYLKSLPVMHGIALAIVGGALGQLGDLGESLLKRSVGVKDSGGIVPGHGGILDRVDALLVTATVLYVYVLFVR